MNIKLNIDGKEYEVIQRLQRKPLPKTWDGADVPIYGFDNRYCALRKLEILRDIYNDGWKADFKDNSIKYGITFFKECINEQNLYHTRCFLNFKTTELRGEFLKNFSGLINEAKELL